MHMEVEIVSVYKTALETDEYCCLNGEFICRTIKSVVAVCVKNNCKPKAIIKLQD